MFLMSLLQCKTVGPHLPQTASSRALSNYELGLNCWKKKITLESYCSRLLKAVVQQEVLQVLLQLHVSVMVVFEKCTRMAKSLKKAILLHPCFTRSYSPIFHICSINQKTALKLLFDIECVHRRSIKKLRVSGVFHREFARPSLQHFSTSPKAESISWGGSLQTVLLRKLEMALNDHQVVEAWEAYNDHRNLYGFPNHSVMSRLVIELSYSSDPQWLQRACDLVFLMVKEKSDLLQPDFLIKLSLSLARAQMPVPTSMIFRLMLQKGNLPPGNVLGMVFLHLVKTKIGSYLASNILVELCDRFQHLSADRSASVKLIKPDTMMFNLVLDACVRFGSSLKGQQIVELMAQTGVVADAHTICIISRIHEMNGLRDELKKFKAHVDQVSYPLARHYRQFYDSLLSLHFKFNDVDSASELVLDMYRCKDSLHSGKDRMEPQKPCLVPIGSQNLREGLKLQILPEQLQKDSVLEVEAKQELVRYKQRRLVLSNKGVARLVIEYKRRGRIGDLSKLLVIIQKVDSFQEESVCSIVFNACINLGWLETAHDILDDMELAGSPLGSSSYTSLLRVYYERKLSREAEALLKQTRKAGVVVKISDEATTLSEVEERTALPAERITSFGKLHLADSIIRQLEEEEKVAPSVVYKLNSSLYFFWKAKMVGDALTTYRKMEAMNIHPTEQTFFIMVSGYFSLDMHREVTILWGDIKRNMRKGNGLVNRDLFEFLVLNFLRGGYFERVMEVIGCMKENGMYVDKWMLKIEFLKFHKDLYRSLKACNAKTDAQSKRIEYVREFRKWVGIN